MLSVDKYIKCIFSDLITVFHQLLVMDFSLAATDSGPLYTSVFYCGGNIFFYIKPVGSWRIYVIMVIGAHDSMIIIKNGGNAIYGATLVTPSLVLRPHLEKLINITLTLSHGCLLTLKSWTLGLLPKNIEIIM